MTTYHGLSALGTCHTRLSVENIKDQKRQLNRMEFPPRNKEVGGWKETKKREKSGKAIRSKPEDKPLEMRQMHNIMPKVIICWPAGNLLVTMIIYNCIERTY